jgi:tetratricopeptide (TPR) repeat protein
MCTNYSKRNTTNLRKFIFGLIFCLFTCSSFAAGYGQADFAKKTSKTLRSLVRVYMAYGQYDKAEPLAEKALNMAKSKNDNDLEISSCYGDLAYLYKNLGKLYQAERVCKKSLELQKRVYFGTHPYVAYTLKTLCSIYRKQYKFDAAKESMDQALKIMLDTHSPNEQSMSPFYVELAKIYTGQKKYDLAEKYYNKSLDMIYKSYGPGHIYTAGVLNSAAEFYLICGKTTKARSLVNKAISIQEKTYGDSHYLIVPSWLTLASIDHSEGNNKAAKNIINRAIAVVSKTGNSAVIAKVNSKLQEIGMSSSYEVIARNSR